MEDIEIEAEVCAAKQRYASMEGGPDRSVDEERRERDIDNRARSITNEGKVSFYNIRATDLDFNKRVFLPNLEDF